jgi:hypothetical protein
MSNTSDPIKFALAVTPNDTNVLTPFRCLYVGVSGDVAVRMYGGGNNITFTGLAVGWHPIQGDKVLATGTTASDIVAGW